MRTIVAFAGMAGMLVAAAVAAGETKVHMDRGACVQLVQHVPADDATYRPGVDVRGRPVASADLGGGHGIKIPDEINIDIGFDVAQRYQMTGPGAAAKGSVGTVTVKNGKAYFNGQPISPNDQAAIAAACKRGG